MKCTVNWSMTVHCPMDDAGYRKRKLDVSALEGMHLQFSKASLIYYYIFILYTNVSCLFIVHSTVQIVLM